MKNIYTTLIVTTGIIIASFATTALVSQSVMAQQSCGGVDTSVLSCDDNANGVWSLLVLAINILTAGVFIAAIGGIVYGAILYTTAGGNQEQVKKARTLILNVVIGMVAFAMMFAALQWLVPGGLFNSSGDLQEIGMAQGVIG